ncbi:hypothetical protein ACFOOL_16385 [Devosia honganensis]|uniref:Uncharacterized protein n=1 Tax=Devosia honganensis TaxID=1610527 RepID=A0ABV7X440_9HYPH
MESTRERKTRFIKSFGDRAARDAVLSLFARYGLDMLSDELLDEATSEMVADAMATTKRVVRNRRIYRRKMALDAASMKKVG